MLKSNGSNRYLQNFHPDKKGYTIFSAPHRNFFKIAHWLGQKASLNKYKKFVITPCILSDHHGLKLEFNNNGNNRKPIKLTETEWLSGHWVREKIKKENIDLLEFSENEETTYLNFWDTMKAVLRRRKVHSIKCLSKKN